MIEAFSEHAKAAMKNNQSFWQFRYGAYTPNAPLPAGDHTADVVVIGGGFTGLSTAREVRKDNPEKKVMVLEASEIGFGASGRNAGFSMTLFGLEPEVTKLRWGMEKTTAAQHYMQDAVAYVKDLIADYGLASDYEHTGMWRMAYSDSQVKRLRNTFDLLTKASRPDSFEFYEAEDIRQQLNAPHAKAAIVERDTGILDPCKHVRELKRIAQDHGAEIYENTAVTDIRRSEDKVCVTTANATITCKQLVVATNAWSHVLPGPRKLRNRQTPVWTYQIVTEPLTEAEWTDMRWQNRMSLEDNRQLVHYIRITKDGRVTFGGADIESHRDGKMEHWHSARCWTKLQRNLAWLFPTLANKPIAYKWGGAVSVNLDMVPEISFVGDRRIIASTGCLGHGVSLTQYNGRTIADLIAGRDTDRSRFWIVNRNAVPMMPSKTLNHIGIQGIAAVLRGVDRFEERKLPM